MNTKVAYLDSLPPSLRFGDASRQAKVNELRPKEVPALFAGAGATIREREELNDPHPGLPPNQRTDLGEGECRVFMKIPFYTQHEVSPPPFVFFQMGEAGRGLMPSVLDQAFKGEL
jgi:hypothetical protein